jgi:protoheme IX farnesyltransferase
MSLTEAWTFAIIAGATGVLILWYFFNLSAALTALLSLFLYAFIYTPLKTINSVAVLMGAIPGAMPCLIGWVAGADAFSTGGWILFALQFLWQFPHFWAMAGLAHGDDTKAGFKLLPSQSGPTKFTAMQSVIYSLLLIPVSLILSIHSIWPEFDFVIMSGRMSLIIVLLANFFMIWRCVQLYLKMDIASARRVMFGSYIYLPVVLLALLADKIH